MTGTDARADARALQTKVSGMPHTRSRALSTIASALALAPKAVRAQAANTVRIGVPVTEGATPLVYAMRTGMFARAGVTVELTRMPSGAAIASAVTGGSIDTGSTNTVSLIIAHAKGIPFVVNAASGNIWLPSSAGGLLVRSDSGLRVPADFIGKTVACAALNDINPLSMQVWMDRSGVDSRGVHFVELPQTAQPAALEAGRVDGVCLLGAAFEIAKSSPQVRFVANILSAISPRYLLSCFIAMPAWVERNRALAERFARVVSDAAAYTNTHHEETLTDLVAFTGIDRDLAARMPRATLATAISAAELQPVIDVCARYKAIDKAFPAAEIISAVAPR